VDNGGRRGVSIGGKETLETMGGGRSWRELNETGVGESASFIEGTPILKFGGQEERRRNGGKGCWDALLFGASEGKNILKKKKLEKD